MLRIFTNSHDHMVAWAEENSAFTYFDDARAIGWGDDDALRAVIIYDRWTTHDCHIHLVSDGSGRFGSRELLAVAYHYPFVMQGRRRVTGLVPADNAKALRLNTHMGFQQEGVMRRAAGNGSDLIVMGMLREECRFIPRKYREGDANGR